jgi:hypothetical protein
MRRPEGVYAPGVFDVTTTPPVRRPVADAIARAGQPNRRARVRQEGWWVRPDRFMVSA